MTSRQNENVALALLAGLVCVFAFAAAKVGVASGLEALSFITGAICVWLTVKESVWNFPIGLLNVATFSVVFFRSQLYADAGLQIVYFVLGIIGWWMWVFGGKNHSPLQVSHASTRELVPVIVLTFIVTIGLWQLLHVWGGSASFWDALTTSISLASQWLLNRKRIESWLGWIFVDLIYIPLYLYKELYLTAVLYAVFLVMATMGLRAWRASWRSERSGVVVGPLAGASSL
jgi:nicotinamide mononucleotide transporter